MEESASVGKNSAAEEYPDDGGGGELLAGYTKGFFQTLTPRSVSFVLQLGSDQIPNFIKGLLLLTRTSRGTAATSSPTECSCSSPRSTPTAPSSDSSAKGGRSCPLCEKGLSQLIVHNNLYI